MPFKRLLWAVPNVFIKFAVSHLHCDVWDMHNNLRAWAEHCPATLKVWLAVRLHVGWAINMSNRSWKQIWVVDMTIKMARSACALAN